MRLLHLSDIHYRHHYPRHHSPYLDALSKMTSPLHHLHQCFQQIDRSQLDGVVISGDLTEGGGVEDYRQLKDTLRSLLQGLPLLVTLGNHDNKAAFRQGWDFHPPLPTSGRNGSDGHIPCNSLMDLLDFRILSLDNAVPEFPNGHISNAQIDWLDQQLQLAGHRRLLLVCHHHLLSTQATLPPASFDGAFQTLVEHSRIEAIVCGHTHHPYQGTFAGKPYVTAPSLSFCGHKKADGQVRFDEHPGYQLLDFHENHFRATPFYLYAHPRHLGDVSFLL